MWDGIIIVIFYHLGHGSISFHGREILMSSLQYAQIFSILQLGTVKAGSQEQSTMILKSMIVRDGKEKISVNYILLDKYLNGCIISAICMSLHSLYFKKSTVILMTYHG